MNDLQAERKAAFDEITGLGLSPWWAENPPAQFAGEPREFCRGMAEQCDLFLLILGPRYGYSPEGMVADRQRSVTQMELEWARAESGRKVRIFIHADALHTDDERQRAFITEVQQFESGLMRFPPFTTTDQLAQQIRQALQDWLAQQDAGIQLWLREIRTRYATFLNPLTGQQMAADAAVVLQLRTEQSFSPSTNSEEDGHDPNSTEWRTRDQTTRNGESHPEHTAAPDTQIPFPRSRHVKRHTRGDTRLPAHVPAHDVGQHTTADTPQSTPSSEASQPQEKGTAHMHPQPIVGSVSELLDRFEHLVLVGDPGSGKSTLLRRLAYDLAVSALAGSITSAHLPLFISAVALGETISHAPAHTLSEVLASYVQSEFTAAGIPAADVSTLVLAVTAAVREGSAVILVDGLDEARTENRRLVVQLLQTAGTNRAILTSRPQATEPSALTGWRACVVEQLDAERRHELIRRAIEAVPPDLQGELAPEELERELRRRNPGKEIRVTVDSAIGELELLLDARPDLTAWAGNPLLLTLIATQYALTWSLPKARARIYEFAVDELLDQRRVSTTRQMTSAQLHHVLQNLALAMSEANLVTVSHDELLTLLSKGTEPYASMNPRLLDELLARTALIQQQSPGRWGFIHLTFQEYLAACALADLRESQRHPILLRHRLSARWEQVYLLLMSVLDLRGESGIQATDRAILTLIAGDQRRVPALGGKDPTHAALLLATRCHDSRLDVTRPLVDAALLRQWRHEWRRTAQALRFNAYLYDIVEAFLPDRLKTNLGELGFTAGILTEGSSHRKPRWPRDLPTLAHVIAAVVLLGFVALVAGIAIVAGQPTVPAHTLLWTDAAIMLSALLIWWTISAVLRGVQNPERAAYLLLLDRAGSLSGSISASKGRWLNGLWRLRDAQDVPMRRAARQLLSAFAAHEVLLPSQKPALSRARQSSRFSDPISDLLQELRRGVEHQSESQGSSTPKSSPVDRSTFSPAIHQLPTLRAANYNTRRQVRSTLAQLDPTCGEFLPDLVATLRDSDEEGRELAAFGIGRLGSAAASAVPALIEVIQHERSESVKQLAILALGKIGPDALPAEWALVDLLRNLGQREEAPPPSSRHARRYDVYDPYEYKRERNFGFGSKLDEGRIGDAALLTLVRMGPTTLLSIFLLATNPSADWRLRDAALNALEESGSPAISYLQRFLGTVQNPERYYIRVAGAFGRIGPAALSQLIALLETAKPSKRRKLGLIEPILLGSIAQFLVLDVRTPILDEVGRLGPAASGALGSLVPLLADRDARVRRAAAEAIQRVYSGSATIAIDPKVLRRALRDRDETMREVVALLASSRPEGRGAITRLRKQAASRAAALGTLLGWFFALILVLPPALGALLLLVNVVWPVVRTDMPANVVSRTTFIDQLSNLLRVTPPPSVSTLLFAAVAYLLAVAASLAVGLTVCNRVWALRLSALRALTLIIGNIEDATEERSAQGKRP